MDERSPGFCKISEAYEKIVQALEPSARPSDDYLLHQFDEVQKGTDLDKAALQGLNEELEENLNKALEAERRAARLFADALKNGQLVRWVWAEGIGKMTPREVREIWEPDPLCPGLDSDLPDFTIPSYRDGNMVFIEERELNEWIGSQLAARNGDAPISQEPTDLEIDEVIRTAGKSISQNAAEKIVRDAMHPRKVRNLRERVRESVKRVHGNQNSGPRGPRKHRAS